jgi:hypothetical protein
MAVNISGDTGIDKITDGSVVADDLASTLDLSGKTITLATDAVDQLSTASGSAPSYSARAWVNFNGTGTVAIRESGNVSSITDNGTGNYTINFTTALPDANYSTVASANQAYWSTACGVNSGQTTTSTVLRITGETAYRDLAEINVAVFR